MQQMSPAQHKDSILCDVKCHMGTPDLTPTCPQSSRVLFANSGLYPEECYNYRAE